MITSSSISAWNSRTKSINRFTARSMSAAAMQSLISFRLANMSFAGIKSEM